MQNNIDKVIYPGKQLIPLLYEAKKKYLINYCGLRVTTHAEKNMAETCRATMEYRNNAHLKNQRNN